MFNPTPFILIRNTLGILLVTAFAGAACVPARPAPLPPAAAPATAMADTAVLESVATDTPLPTLSPVPTETPTPLPTFPSTPTPFYTATLAKFAAPTPTSPPPHVTILEHAACNFGPGTDYLLKYGLFAGNWMRVVGRNPDGTWLNIKSLHDPLWNACWIQAGQVRFDTGELREVPIVWTTYPYAYLYQPPAVVSASRAGNAVTISWQPVYMTEDDVRGYLVEAWVCQGGRQVFVPVGLDVSFAQNNNTDSMSLQVSDEPGCNVPSNARLYTVDKHGYTAYREIPWPAFEPNSTASETPLPAGMPPPATAGLPVVEIPEYTDCLVGPGTFFLYKTSLLAGTWMELTGRSQDGSWIAVEEPNGWDPCWIPVTQAVFNAGSLETVPVVAPTLPHSFFYRPPNASARREGSQVTVSWQAIGMSEHDYRGYLIIAQVCQAGELVYLPLDVVPPFAENTGILSAVLQDEPGCKGQSSATIYTAEKRGYSGEMIFWPAP